MTTKTEEKKPETQSKELQLLKKNLTDSVLERVKPMIENKELRLPDNYSPGNALQSAWFDLLEAETADKKPVLDACTKESIANSLYKMVTLGLSSAKKQGSFIAYGRKLTFQPEYTGNVALAKRYGNVTHVNAGVIYDGDVFEFAVNVDTGRRKIVKHEQKLENINIDKIKGAYAVLLFSDKSEPYLEVMNIEMIRKAWNQGPMKGKSGAHTNFTDQMCIKTVINRACKLFFRASDDAALFDHDDDHEESDIHAKAVKEEISDNANKEEMGFDPYDEIKEDEVEKTEEVMPNPEKPEVQKNNDLEPKMQF